MTSASEHRGRGSNRHLAGFLKEHNPSTEDQTGKMREGGDVKNDPHVMVTTSLLSRGLDFATWSIFYIVLDDLGEQGNVERLLFFGEVKGRGNER